MRECQTASIEKGPFIKARSGAQDRVCDAGLLRREPGVTPVRSFRDIRWDMGS